MKTEVSDLDDAEDLLRRHNHPVPTSARGWKHAYGDVPRLTEARCPNCQHPLNAHRIKTGQGECFGYYASSGVLFPCGCSGPTRVF